MLYNLFDWLKKTFDLPGAGMFQYISFRMALATLLSLFLSMIIGKYVIRFLQKKQIGESIRDLGLAGQMEKKGTPTMGGIIILSSILISVLLFNRLDNIYILLMIFTTVWLGLLGFIDDYVKVFKKNKQGISSKLKLIGQSILGLVVALVLFLHPDVVIKEKCDSTTFVQTESVFQVENSSAKGSSAYECVDAVKSTKTTIPFVKNNEFDYAVLLKWLGDGYEKWTWILYIPIIIFIIVAVSNGANLTDGLDGLAIATTAIIGATLGILAYVSGNIIFADYLNIMYIPNTGELMIFTGALIGASLGFYWWNCFPAQVFMGDTGSLALGGIVAVFAVIIRKELLIPILCGIYLVQSVSVLLQVSYFKYTKKKYGEGKRLFLMAPIHHHYQKKGYHESKIVQRFVIIGIMLAVLTVVTLKIR
ncbi:MAG TPA: phospho-N-acetylmuramoyl-pentapeptide-transferase [Bacteroidales bacterium]|nr:phospho-N-acetylmuramoyl-pentapeptide-transferase [Bacteroidales bacterium]